MGLFDSFGSTLSGGMLDPNQAALMGLAQGLLAASGPTRVPTKLGSAFAQGLAQAQQGATSAYGLQNQQLELQSRRQQLLMNNLMFQRQKELLEAADNLYNGNGNASNASVAMGQGAYAQPNVTVPGGVQLQGPEGAPFGPVSQSGDVNMGGVGPTPENAARMQAPAAGPSVDPLNPLGLDPRLARYGMLSDPQKYIESAIVAPAAQRAALTDFEKTMIHQGIDPASPAGRQLMQEQLQRLNYIAPVPARAGTTLLNARTNIPYFTGPTQSGAWLQWGPNGPTMGTVPGALETEGAMAAAAGGGKAFGTTAFTPTTVYKNGVTGVQLGYQAFGMNPSMLFGGTVIPSNSAPTTATPPALPAAPMVPPAISARTTSAPRGGGFVQTGPAIGEQSFVETQATGAGKGINDLIAQAKESPMRVNVLDNIISLSKGGVDSGPTSEFKNRIKGYVAGTPGLSSIASSWKDDVSGFQELQKFTYQNALRNWAAAGGTQTDSQLELQSHANPNDKLFPTALQHIAQWGKASELALMAKASAWQKWQQTKGNTWQQQQDFENDWRKNFRPSDYIKQTIDPVNANGWQLHQDSKSGELAYVNPKNPKQFVGIWQ
jgi:hypothetical protein